MPKRDRIKHVISSISRFRILKRPSMTKLKTRIVVFLGSIMLIINIFTAYPAYADSGNINNKPVMVSVVIRRDIPVETEIGSLAKNSESLK